jgi:hypothetical protein
VPKGAAPPLKGAGGVPKGAAPPFKGFGEGPEDGLVMCWCFATAGVIVAAKHNAHAAAVIEMILFCNVRSSK